MYILTFKANIFQYLSKFIPQIINSGVVIVLMFVLYGNISRLNAISSLLLKSLTVIVSTCVMGLILHQYNPIDWLKKGCRKIESKLRS